MIVNHIRRSYNIKVLAVDSQEMCGSYDTKAIMINQI